MKKSFPTISIVLGLSLLTNITNADERGPLVGLDYLEEVNQRIVNIDTVELEKLIQQDPSLVVIDVRQESEVNAGGGMIDARREIIVPRGWLEFCQKLCGWFFHVAGPGQTGKIYRLRAGFDAFPNARKSHRRGLVRDRRNRSGQLRKFWA
jgi:hypothetical protein